MRYRFSFRRKVWTETPKTVDDVYFEVSARDRDVIELLHRHSTQEEDDHA